MGFSNKHWLMCVTKNKIMQKLSFSALFPAEKNSHSYVFVTLSYLYLFAAQVDLIHQQQGYSFPPSNLW